MSFLDNLLDRSVLPSFTNLGYRLRRLSPDDFADFTGKRVLITGASSGLGSAAAMLFAQRGATVHLVVRNEEKGQQYLDSLLRQVPHADLHLEVCDVSSLSDVRRFADDFVSRDGVTIDVVVHNAGVMPAERTESADGHELSVATHVLGPLLLTDLLQSAMTACRTIWVSSGGMYGQKLPVSDPDYHRGSYSAATAYARSKRMQVSLAALMHQRWSPRASVHIMHPGWADTPGVQESLPGFAKVMGPLLRTPQQAVDTVVWLAGVQPEPRGGQFWHDRRARSAHYLPGTKSTDAEVLQMWDWVRHAAGLA